MPRARSRRTKKRVPTVGYDPIFSEHDTGEGHPERSERARVLGRWVDAHAELHAVTARPATAEELGRAHAAEYVDEILSLDGGTGRLDADTAIGPRSVQAALHAAGLTIDLFAHVAAGGEPGLALVRPPGHHATRDRAMGFCLFNNVAVAARALQAEHGVERIAIFDWDVHHGNGTQDIFYGDPSVLYLSTHQWPLYPGTGAASERGEGAGAGATVNVTLPSGSTDDDILEASERVLEPAVRDFRPDMILISAGYDALAVDPLAGLELTPAGFGALATRWRALADEICQGRIAGALEGGYHLDGLTQSVEATLTAWT